MKTVYSLSFTYLFILLIYSCTPTTEINSNFQFEIENETWKTNDAVVYENQKNFEIIAMNNDEEFINLELNDNQEGLYEILGPSENKRIVFNDGVSHKVNKYGANQENNLVTLDNINQENNTVSGSFTADLGSYTTVDLVQLKNGEFSDLPIEAHPFSGHKNNLKAEFTGIEEEYSNIQVSIYNKRIQLASNVGNDEDLTFEIHFDQDIEVGEYNGSDKIYTELAIKVSQYDETRYFSTGGDKFEITRHDKKFRVLEGDFEVTVVHQTEFLEFKKGNFSIRY